MRARRQHVDERLLRVALLEERLEVASDVMRAYTVARMPRTIGTRCGTKVSPSWRPDRVLEAGEALEDLGWWRWPFTA
jgi:hypothetical protein